MTHEKTFPVILSFLLDNPIRRRLDRPEKILRKLGVNGMTSVLDFGCGPGFYTIPFAKTAGRVVAVDLQPAMLEKVAKKAMRQGLKVETLQSNGRRVDLPDDSFDLIFLNHVYHEVDEKQTVLMELRRLLRPNGRIAIVESTKKPFLGLGPPAMNPDEIGAELRTAGFSSVDVDRDGKHALILAIPA